MSIRPKSQRRARIREESVRRPPVRTGGLRGRRAPGRHYRGRLPERESCGRSEGLDQVQCRSTEGVSYSAIEGDPSAANAEACEQCRTYLKLFYLEKTPQTERFADDVATLSLDLLTSEKGFSRSGVNLFLLPGVQH